eukprot:PhM_4_TR9272/c0_g1_i1/m.53008
MADQHIDEVNTPTLSSASSSTPPPSSYIITRRDQYKSYLVASHFSPPSSAARTCRHKKGTPTNHQSPPPTHTSTRLVQALENAHEVLSQSSSNNEQQQNDDKPNSSCCKNAVRRLQSLYSHRLRALERDNAALRASQTTTIEALKSAKVTLQQHHESATADFEAMRSMHTRAATVMCALNSACEAHSIRQVVWCNWRHFCATQRRLQAEAELIADTAVIEAQLACTQEEVARKSEETDTLRYVLEQQRALSTDANLHYIVVRDAAAVALQRFSQNEVLRRFHRQWMTWFNARKRRHGCTLQFQTKTTFSTRPLHVSTVETQTIQTHTTQPTTKHRTKQTSKAPEKPAQAQTKSPRITHKGCTSPVALSQNTSKRQSNLQRRTETMNKTDVMIPPQLGTWYPDPEEHSLTSTASITLASRQPTMIERPDSC